MRRRGAAVLLACLLVWAGCSGVTRVRPRTDVPEPAVSPPLAVPPAGQLVTLPSGAAPEGLVADSRSGVLAAGVRNPGGVLLLDLANRQIRARITLPATPRHLRLAHPGGPLLVPAEGADRLYLLTLPSGRIAASFPTGRQPHDVAVAGGAYVVGDELASTVHFIRLGQSSTILPGPSQPGGVAASSDGSTVMVVGVRGRAIEQINPDGTVVGSAACGVGPTHIRGGTGGLFYVADTEGDRILIFEAGPRGPRNIGSVPTGRNPYGLALDQRRSLLYVTLTGTNQLQSFRIAGHRLRSLRTWPTVRQPNDVTVVGTTGAVIVAGTVNSNLEFFAP